MQIMPILKSENIVYSRKAKKSDWIGFLCGPYGQPIISLTVSFYFITEEIGLGDWFFYYGLDLTLMIIAAWFTWRNWQSFVRDVKKTELFLYGGKARLVLIGFAITYIICLVSLYGLGAVGDSRHEVFREYRILDQLSRISQLGLSVFVWFSPVWKSIAISFGLVTSNAFFPLSKGSLFNQTLFLFFVYALKWRYSLSKSHNVLILSTMAVTVIGGLAYTQITAERFGIDPSLILELSAKRLFFPNDIYNDFYNLPQGMIKSETLSPLIFFEFISKVFYDETPFGTIGSVLRSGMENPDIVTGGTPYLSLHLAFLAYNKLYVILGIVFLLVCFASLCILARNPMGLQRQLAWLLIGIPAIYVSDYSGLSMRLFHVLILVAIFNLSKLNGRGAK